MKNEYRAMRQKAIQRYLAGEKPVHIYRDLDMSRKWFYKWLHRHNPEDLNWASDRSQSPQDIFQGTQSCYRGSHSQNTQTIRNPQV